ncbi:MAG: glycosyltransferase family 4 protein [Microthrixaceae bacterium]
MASTPGSSAPGPPASDATLKAIDDLATRAGIRRVHVLGWRDLDDDEAGGSELHADSILSIWARAGLRITMRTSASGGRPPVDVRHGYTVSRRGGRYSVFLRTPAAELAGRLGRADALVEIWNGMPFLSPMWWRGPSVVWMHHVHGPMWDQTLPPLQAKLGHLIEERLAPPWYRRRSIVTLSPSSLEEMVEEQGFDRDAVTVIPPGIGPAFTPGGERSLHPRVVAVGRLAPVKDFPRLVKLMHRARARVPDLELVIVGEGYVRDDLAALVSELDAGDWVRLAGHVSDDELIELYRSAWMVASTSTREGWGMTLTEAAATGTPAVVTDIAGHADAVHHDRSGLLATTDDQLVDATVRVITDRALRRRLEEGALARAAELTWEACALANFEVLAQDALRRRR